MPLIAGLAIVVMAGNIWPGWGWRRAFVRGVVASAAYMVVATEILSLFHGVTVPGLMVVWLLPIMVGVGLWLRVRGAGGGRVAWPPLRVPRDGGVLAQWGMVGVALVLTGVVAWLAPPQTWDSLTYHMARVAHWAQNGSLAHYATGIPRQNLMSPGAEIGMLQVYVLAGGDRLVNFVQWTAMVVSVVTAGFVAGEMGAGKRGQAFAGVFVATLPMGISEATSTMTDYVAAVWMICLAYEAVGYVKGRGGLDGYVFLGLTSGLAALTKPTTFPYLLPIAVLLVVVGLRRHRWRRLGVGGMVVVVMAVAVNLGYWGRNTLTYGNPMGSSYRIARNGNAILGPKVVISNVLRNASLQAGTPWPSVNHEIFRLITGIHYKMGIDPNDPRTTAHQGFQVYGPSQSETRSANLSQAVVSLIVLAALVFLALRRWPSSGLPAIWAVVTIAGFVVSSALFKFTPFGSRYQMIFFVLVAPIAAWVLGKMDRLWVTPVVSALLLIYAWPWLVGINQRPLLPDKDGRSLLSQPRSDFVVGDSPGLNQSYQSLAQNMQAAGCQNVGVMLGGDAAEYPLFVALGAPKSGVRLEWIVAGVPSAQYRDPNFTPCAIVCDTSCPSTWNDVNGLPLAETLGGFRLYMGK
jgi:hypothetical protein